MAGKAFSSFPIGVLGLCLWLGCLAPAGEGAGDLDEILAKPEYNRWRNTLVTPDAKLAPTDREAPSWLDSLFARLDRWLSSDREKKPAQERSRTAGRASSLVLPAEAFALLGYVLLAATVAFLVVSLFLYLGGRERPPPKPARRKRVGIARALEEGDALACDKAEWSRQADRFLADGELRLAFRSLYLGLLSGLHEQGRIAFIQNRTNWHYVRSFRGRDEARRAFAEMTDIFDRVWYGVMPVIDNHGLARMRERVAALLAEGGGHA